MKFPKLTNCCECKYYREEYGTDEICLKNQKMDACICFKGKNKKKQKGINQINCTGDNNINIIK